MSTARTEKGGGKSWWASRRNRTRLWVTLIAGGAISVSALLWIINQSSSGVMNEGAVPVGQKVDARKLEDSRTGQTFDIGQLLGKTDIVLVAYMGDFCLGCRELVGELQQRAPKFEAADAQLVVLGYEVGQTGRNTAAKHGVTAYPLLQEGTPNTFTRSIGMWSDMMGMPFMGYVIIDKSGKIVAGEQTSLSEAKGAAPANVDQLMTALANARVTAGETSLNATNNARLVSSTGRGP